MVARGEPFEWRVVEGVGHGFTRNTSRGYRPDAGAEGWRLPLDFLDRELRQGGDAARGPGTGPRSDGHPASVGLSSKRISASPIPRRGIRWRRIVRGHRRVPRRVALDRAGDRRHRRQRHEQRRHLRGYRGRAAGRGRRDRPARAPSRPSLLTRRRRRRAVETGWKASVGSLSPAVRWCVLRRRCQLRPARVRRRRRWREQRRREQAAPAERQSDRNLARRGTLEPGGSDV